MMKKWINSLLCLCLLEACITTPAIPTMAKMEALRIIRYRDVNGVGLIPVARSAGEARTQLWRKWFYIYADKWNRQINQKVDGKTLWCTQWIADHSNERICRRDTGLIWFGHGVLNDSIAIELADKIWYLR